MQAPSVLATPLPLLINWEAVAAGPRQKQLPHGGVRHHNLNMLACMLRGLTHLPNVHRCAVVPSGG